MVQTSPTIQNLAKALVSFNQKVNKIVKDESNPFFKSKYATLSHILDVINEPLNAAGLVVTQWPTGENALTSRLIHAESGEWIESTYLMTGHKNTPQERGSLISYQRRYAISSILNLNIADDDDGNAATFGQHGKPAAIPQVNGTRQVMADNIPAMINVPDGEKPWLNIGSKEYNGAVAKMKEGKSTLEALRKYFKISKKTAEALVADAGAEL
jgi:hypothetical protein